LNTDFATQADTTVHETDFGQPQAKCRLKIGSRPVRGLWRRPTNEVRGCPLVAHSGHANRRFWCPLGAKRTWR